MRYILVSACLLGVRCRYDGGSNPIQEIIQLQEQADICLIPVCPEQLGGLATPRPPAERRGNRVVNCRGEDVTGAFRTGAEEALRIAKLYGCACAILKERSPSCGTGYIYDGTFTGKVLEGQGVTAALLRENGIEILSETGINR